jgi:adenylate cyclase
MILGPKRCSVRSRQALCFPEKCAQPRSCVKCQSSSPRRSGLDNVVRCISLGAEDYLNKPVNQVLLKARIGASLEKKRLRDQQKALVRRFATSEVADDMLQSGFALGGKRIHASVLFSDIRGFTALVESQGPEETIDLLNTYDILMFDAIGGHGGVVNQMIGDGLMALFGAPLPLDNCAGSAVAAGHGMCRGIDLLVKLCHILRAA